MTHFIVVNHRPFQIELYPVAVKLWWRDEELYFNCMAEDFDHAAEQALDSYPDAVVQEIEFIY